MQNAEDLFNRGLEFKNVNDYKSAIDAFNSAIQLQWSFTAAYIEAGNCASLLRDFNLALKFYSSAIETDPVSPVPYYNIGLTFLDLQNQADAIKWFQETLRIDPQYRAAYIHLAQQHAAARHDRLAIRLLIKAAYVPPYMAAPLVAAGKLYYQSTFELQAIRCFERAVRIDAWNGDAYFQLGFAEWRKGDFARATRSLSFAVNADPNNKLAATLLRRAYERLTPKQQQVDAIQESLFNDSVLSAA